MLILFFVSYFVFEKETKKDHEVRYGVGEKDHEGVGGMEKA